ncbi:MAG: iron ABC transporter substrate-binding protein [Nanobdellota archaeon]
MKKKLIISIILLLLIAGCSSTGDSYVSSKSKKVIDMAGREVSVPANVTKIVGLEAGALRIITYLNATQQVTGVEEFEKRDNKRPYILAHPELKTLPSIGPIHGGNAELIVSSQPDVIFWTYTTRKAANDLQRKTGIPVIVLEYGNLIDKRKEFFSSLKLVAKIINKNKRATELIEYINTTIKDLGNHSKPKKQKSVYVGGVAHKGAHGITSTEPSYDPFVFLEADNVCSGLGTDHVNIDPEMLIKWDPDYIFIDKSGEALIRDEFSNNSKQYSLLNAYQNNNIFGILPYNWYTTNYATVLSNAYYIGSVIYPARFTTDPEKKAKEIYRFFLGKNVYPQMKEIYGGYHKIDLQ